MPNGSLDKSIFNSGGDGRNPNWEIRLNIVSGVAEALNYLHNRCEETTQRREIFKHNVGFKVRIEIGRFRVGSDDSSNRADTWLDERDSRDTRVHGAGDFSDEQSHV